MTALIVSTFFLGVLAGFLVAMAVVLYVLHSVRSG